MKIYFSKIISGLLLCLVSLPLLAEPATGTIKASYDVIGFGMTLANITETFTRTKDNYQIESITKAVGLLAKLKPETVRVTSHGKITAQGLVPLAYAMTREVDTQKNASAKFNWEKAMLTHNDYKGLQDLPLLKGTQDRLSVLYHLPLLANSAQSDFKFNITDGNNVDPYSFKLAAEEQNIQVPLGNFKTRYISSTPVAEEIKYEIWMATERDNFPCKIIATDSKGGKLTQVLTSLSTTP